MTWGAWLSTRRFWTTMDTEERNHWGVGVGGLTAYKWEVQPLNPPPSVFYTDK